MFSIYNEMTGNNLFREAKENGTAAEKFPELLVIIRSISGLLNLLSGEKREMLSLILGRGRAEYGIHVIVGDRQKEIAALAYEKWFRTQVSPSDGLWIGSGISEQYVLKPLKITPEMRKPLPPAFGWSLQKGKAILVKFPGDRDTEEEDEG